jgi:hypothetical protein
MVTRSMRATGGSKSGSSGWVGFVVQTVVNNGSKPLTCD